MVCADTLEGFYYVGVLGWHARCKTVQECVALLDLVEISKEKLKATYLERELCSETIYYLSHRIQREQDPVLLAAMKRKMRNMESFVHENLYIYI